MEKIHLPLGDLANGAVQAKLNVELQKVNEAIINIRDYLNSALELEVLEGRITIIA